MTTTVKHEGSAREWEGSLEHWEAHSECIKHWCNGGEVEIYGAGHNWYALIRSKAHFDARGQYRIKQRKPKAGEVWFVDGSPCLYTILSKGDIGQPMPWIELYGKAIKCNAEHRYKQFIADNLEQYYANKFKACENER